MASPNIAEIATASIEARSSEIFDNVTKNNALLSRLKQKKKIRTFDGGLSIREAVSYAENSNAGWYSGYDLLPIAAQDVLSSADFTIKQAAVPVVVSGLEMLQNAGKAKILDLVEERQGVAEATMANLIAAGLYSDGTGAGGKQLTGLGAAVVASPTTGTYGGINRANFPFWRNYATGSLGAQTASNIQGNMNKVWANLVRGNDRPDLILFDSNLWATYMASLQALQRFTSAESASLGFPSVKYMDADVVLDGGLGGFAPANAGYFLNTKYLFFRPHAQRNMVPLSPNKRTAINQDAEVSIIGFAGNLTCGNASLQGYFQGS